MDFGSPACSTCITALPLGTFLPPVPFFQRLTLPMLVYWTTLQQFRLPIFWPFGWFCSFPPLPLVLVDHGRMFSCCYAHSLESCARVLFYSTTLVPATTFRLIFPQSRVSLPTFLLIIILSFPKQRVPPAALIIIFRLILTQQRVPLTTRTKIIISFPLIHT